MRWPWQKKEPLETRATGSGFTAEIMAARESYISGRRGIGELTGVVQTCISLWECGLSIADVKGTDLLRPFDLAIAARSCALRGEAVFLIGSDRLIPASDWDLRTRSATPTAYRLSISDAGGGRSFTALAGEVLHFRIGADVAAPYYGQAPLRRASITAAMLNAIEEALRQIFEDAPLGSMVLPFPENPETSNEKLSRGFRGKRGRVLLRESVNSVSAGAPTPQTDWRPSDLSPDLSRSMTKESLDAARQSISSVYGVLPALLNEATTGPLVREAQRHLAQWVLQPMAMLFAQEASEKLGGQVEIECTRPLQAFDTGGRARAFSSIVETLANAKESGIPASDVQRALALVDWASTE